MGFLTRLLAGLTAAAALGAGLTGTANAVDVTGTTGNTKSVVKLTADDTNNLPDHIVNGGFDYPSVPSWTALPGSNKYNKGKLYATINPGTGKYGSGCAMSTSGKAIPNWNRLNFAWNSTQGDTHYSGGMSCEAGNVELNYDSVHHNQFAELTADQQGTAIYQDVKVTPGTMMKWSLKHSSVTSAYVDKMQVMIGEPYKETAQEATRIASENGNKVGEKMTTISTPTTSDRADNKKWDTYSGTYLVPDGVTTVRFTFKSVASAEWYSGNDLDDIEFSRSYKLAYDKNSSDAAGEVPSNQRGKENTTQPAKDKTSGTVKTVADTNANLPDHLVNGDFSVNYHDQWKDSFGGWTSIDPNAGKTLHATSLPNGSSWKWTAINGWDKSKFGWTSTQKAGSNVQQKANAVELQYDDSTADNVYAELCAYEAGTAIYQDIRTVPGTLYKVRLKHASLNSTYLDKMQVMIGTPGHEQPVEMTRTSVNGHGDKLNEKSTVIATKVTNGNNRHHADQWETYEGTYLIPDGQTTTRFTFRSIDSKQLDYGNVLDDIVFDKAYRLDYDKNASDATGEVPSNQRGRENTVQPAKTKATGTVKTIADTNVNNLPDHLINGDFEYPTADIMGKSDREFWYISQNDNSWWANVAKLTGKEKRSPLPAGFDKSKFAWHSTQTGNTHYPTLERADDIQVDYKGDGTNHYSEITAAQAGSTLYQDVATTPGVMYRWSLKHTSINSANIDRMSVMIGEPGKETAQEATRTTVNGHGDKTGKVGTEIATKVSNSVSDQWNRVGQWETYTGTYIATSTVTRFAFHSIEGGGKTQGEAWDGNLLDDVTFTKAYKLSYDKNAQDATGSIPSNTTPDTTQTASSTSTGKVSDLVQRTTTHEDGSVTVRTVDTTTDVVSGCQVYYPAGQRITLATLAKDDDCWDSSMLSRPGHTQLGWNQDRNATAAQPEVTMVEGGMTVYAVWVGNPVLTYDTNKPNTWNGQMPSTPASVSVSYNTAAADGSGWQSGDTSKIRGYRFLGWYAGPQDDAGLYDWNTLLTGNVTVYAHWQRLQANVVYDANGGTGSHANTTGWQYSDVTVPSDTSKSFKRDGYYFKYWNTQKDGKGTTYKDSAQVPLQDKNVTLYAIWAPYHTVITETGGIGLPVLVTGGIVLLVMGIGSTVMLTRRMRGER
ncbi:surface protein [Bifidobacterium catenulatum subsp. kashiwanohense]|uniref:InlB B-repeat-containing protein n=1 Tax=Bifidobacterium catenulatum TaxID=1686 RepID=UPI0012B4C23B|nr:InlB B-repeat-containing protein [Bifidobacterium catenulatum]QGM62723.1 surface protein [Bifidobacterium catenulatum subsp. kashiwanohense]